MLVEAEHMLKPICHDSEFKLGLESKWETLKES